MLKTEMADGVTAEVEGEAKGGLAVEAVGEEVVEVASQWIERFWFRRLCRSF